MAFTLSPGNYADISSASARLLADTGYDANSLRCCLATTATQAVIPSTKSRPPPNDAEAYVSRKLIECAFCRLKGWRRIATQYDKLTNNFASAVAIAAIILWWT